MEKFMGDLLLDEDDGGFSLNNSLNLSPSIRLNAFGARDTATIEEAEARFAFRLTKNSRWLGREELSKAGPAEEAGEGASCRSFSHQLKVFAHPEANRACVSYMMSRLTKMRGGGVDSETMRMWRSWVCYFCFIAALRAESIGCRRLVVVVEISA